MAGYKITHKTITQNRPGTARTFDHVTSAWTSGYVFEDSGSSSFTIDADVRLGNNIILASGTTFSYSWSSTWGSTFAISGGNSAFLNSNEVFNTLGLNETTVLTYNPPYYFSITYLLNGGINNPNNTYTYQFGVLKSLFPPNRHGYTFSTWSEGNDFPIGTNGNKTKTAIWDALSYDIIWELNGGVNDPRNPNEYETGESYVFYPSTRNGYNFVQYNNDEGDIITGITSGQWGEQEIYAVWDVINYSISYQNGGFVPDANSPTLISSYNIETPTFDLISPTKRGYTFNGFYSNADFSGEVVTQVVLGSTGNLVIYMKWTLNTYNITYNNNGGAFNPDNLTSFNVNTETFSILSTTKRGFAFGGYYMEEDFSGAVINQITKGTYVTNIVLYAKWTIVNYNINYSLYGGTLPSNAPYTFTVNTNTFYLEAPNKRGYTFGGFYNNNSFTGEVISQIVKGTYATNINLYVKWDINTYNLTFVMNGGSGGVNRTFNVTTPTFSVGTATKAGYTFGGYYLNADFSGEQITEISMGAYVENITLYAKWNVITYNLTYQLNGGTGATNRTFTIETPTFNVVSSTRNGYAFGGYYLTGDFSGTQISQIVQGTYFGNITLYAKWDIITYEIKYNSEGTVDLPSGRPLNYNVTTQLSSVLGLPIRVGYNFNGYFTDVGLTTPLTNNTLIINTGQTGDINIYLKWTIRQGVVELRNRYIARNGMISDTQIAMGTFTYGQLILLSTSGGISIFNKIKQSNYNYEFVGWGAKNDVANTNNDAFDTPTYPMSLTDPTLLNDLIPALGEMDAVLVNQGVYYAVWKRNKNGLKKDGKSVKINIGSNKVKKVYKGNDIIWERPEN